MKLLIALVALALGSAATALILKIQNDPLAFTSVSERRSMESLPPVQTPEKAVEALLVPEPRFFQLEEVTIIGERRRPAPEPEPGPANVTIPAPCRDGEYRLLEPKRGVRLMCPGQSLK